MKARVEWWVAALLAGVLLALALGAPRARATTGGPELSEPLGYDPHTGDVYFRQIHGNAGDYRPTILRLPPGRGGRLFDPVRWSVGEDVDSTYSARVARLTRSLRKLAELTIETIPGWTSVEAVDTIDAEGVRLARFQARVSSFEAAAGEIRATTYFEPSVRVVRWFQVPGRDIVLGIVSFRGIPYEMNYEVQVPVAMPGQGETLVIPDQWWRGGYPREEP